MHPVRRLPIRLMYLWWPHVEDIDDCCRKRRAIVRVTVSGIQLTVRLQIMKRRGEVRRIDGRHWHRYPSNLRFRRARAHRYSLDTRSNQRIATIELDGDVGNTQYDPVSRHIFVNVQTLAQHVEIDPSRNVVVKRYSLGGTECIGNHGC